MADAMVFPGQGSQAVGIQADLAGNCSEVADTWTEAGEVLGYDVWALVQSGPAEELARTTITQPVMLAAGVAAFRAWRRGGGRMPVALAGHSLGEYSALVAAGAMEFADAMRVVKRRSELMRDAGTSAAGKMAAIIGLDDETLVDMCQRVADSEVVEAVNFNAPGQVVVAGHVAAVDRVIEAAKSAGARAALPLPVTVAAHSSLMRPAGEALTAALAEVEINAPAVTVIAASDGRPYVDGDDIRQRLASQVYSPVQWVRTIEALLALGADRVVECGPGRVLAGLMRRIDRRFPVATLDSADGLSTALAA